MAHSVPSVVLCWWDIPSPCQAEGASRPFCCAWGIPSFLMLPGYPSLSLVGKARCPASCLTTWMPRHTGASHPAHGCNIRSLSEQVLLMMVDAGRDTRWVFPVLRELQGRGVFCFYGEASGGVAFRYLYISRSEASTSTCWCSMYHHLFVCFFSLK